MSRGVIAPCLTPATVLPLTRTRTRGSHSRTLAECQLALPSLLRDAPSMESPGWGQDSACSRVSHRSAAGTSSAGTQHRAQGFPQCAAQRGRRAHAWSRTLGPRTSPLVVLLLTVRRPLLYALPLRSTCLWMPQHAAGSKATTVRLTCPSRSASCPPFTNLTSSTAQPCQSSLRSVQ